MTVLARASSNLSERPVGGDREKDELMSLLTKIRGKHRQKRDFISVILFFRKRKADYKT
jgi:hypothetical protein